MIGFDGVRRAIDRDARGLDRCRRHAPIPRIEAERAATRGRVPLGRRLPPGRRDGERRRVGRAGDDHPSRRRRPRARVGRPDRRDDAIRVEQPRADGVGHRPRRRRDVVRLRPAAAAWPGWCTPGGARTIGRLRARRSLRTRSPTRPGCSRTLLREPNGFVVGARHADGSGLGPALGRDGSRDRAGRHRRDGRRSVRLRRRRTTDLRARAGDRCHGRVPVGRRRSARRR